MPLWKKVEIWSSVTNPLHNAFLKEGYSALDDASNDNSFECPKRQSLLLFILLFIYPYPEQQSNTRMMIGIATSQHEIDKENWAKI